MTFCAYAAGATTDVVLGGYDWTPDVQLFTSDPRVQLTLLGPPGDALVPPQSLSDERQALGRVLDERDLFRIRADEPRRELAGAAVLGVPVAPVQRTPLALVERMPGHCVGGARRERPYGSVVEVDDVLRDGEEGLQGRRIRLHDTSSHFIPSAFSAQELSVRSMTKVSSRA